MIISAVFFLILIAVKAPDRRADILLRRRRWWWWGGTAAWLIPEELRLLLWLRRLSPHLSLFDRARTAFLGVLSIAGGVDAFKYLRRGFYKCDCECARYRQLQPIQFCSHTKKCGCNWTTQRCNAQWFFMPGNAC
jgi:hypothetical protein